MNQVDNKVDNQVDRRQQKIQPRIFAPARSVPVNVPVILLFPMRAL